VATAAREAMVEAGLAGEVTLIASRAIHNTLGELFLVESVPLF